MNKGMVLRRGELDRTNILADFGEFLRLYTAEGDASPLTIKNYHAQAGQFVKWCDAERVNPARATEHDVIAYRKHLVDAGFKPSTVALKLAVVRRLYEAARWRGLRQDNPALGVKAPRDRTAQDERVKYLPLEGLKAVLAAPKGDRPQAVRDRAILALMGIHGLRRAEVACLQLAGLDLDGKTARVTGKGRKVRTVYLIPRTVELLSSWLRVRETVGMPDVAEVFVVTGNRSRGSGLSVRAVAALVDKYLAAVGLKSEGISCHALRHSAATWSRFGGAKLDTIADMLGHSSTDTTRIYARVVDKMTDNPARYLEAVMGQSLAG